jgi:two-component system, NarL family, response regulator DevR
VPGGTLGEVAGLEGKVDAPCRVLVVDDHEVVRQGVRKALSGVSDIDLVSEAATAAEGLRGILAARPDVALVDVRLPDGSGVELIREIHSRQPQTRCIIFTSAADDEAFFQSVVAGCAGYLVKDVSMEELVAAIRTVAAGGSLVRREVIDDLRRRARTVPIEPDLFRHLTGQEQRILRMVTQGMTNREIAAELSLAEKTVRNYVSNILGKVGMKNRTQLAAYVASETERRRH